jgi:ribulose-5-phosphate 4-epimerase/fuculose-1-phosphate aldolase
MTHALEIPSLKGKVSDEEWQVRCDLAACYRLVAMYGWTDLIFTHLTARLPGRDHLFLINPYGLMFDEITASSLVKIDLDGNKRDDSPFPVNRAGFIIHSAIHSARENAQCVMHTHTRAGTAVSAQEEGLLPLSQHASLVLGSLGYHDYEGIATRPDEVPRLQSSLGDNSFLMLRNHGLLTVGASIAEAFRNMYYFETSCQIQIAAQAGGGKLREVDRDTIDLNANAATVSGGRQALIEMVWTALRRKLDRTSADYAT